MSLKIAHIVRRFTFSEWGGTESVVWNIARCQKAQGLMPEIICTAALDKVGTEVVDGIVIKRFPYFYPYFPMPERDRIILDKKGGNPLSPQLLKYLKKGHFDIFHIHAGGRVAQYASTLGKNLSIPCLMSLHGGACVIPQQEMELMLKPLQGKFSYGGIIDRMYSLPRPPEKGMDVLLALSKAETQALGEKYPGKKVLTFPNGIMHRELPSDSSSFRSRYNIPSDAKLILCISRIDYQKNQKLAIDLLYRTENTHLLLIGPVTSEWYKDELITYAREKNVFHRLTIIPGLPPQSVELLESLKEADCFLLPSRHEPFGIVALEALDAGVPLIASKVGGLLDFLVHRENALLFEDNDPESLFQAWSSVEELRSTLISNGRKTADSYNWQALTEKLTAIYRELLP